MPKQNKTFMETITNLFREKFPHLEISLISEKTLQINGIIQYKDVFRLCHEWASVKEYRLLMLDGLTIITFL